MVILSTGICNKSGKLLLSRQFQHFTRTAIQDIYLSFPKLLSSNQQHTYAQSQKYTFLYIPIDSLFLVLVSSKNSNIIQDQQTIKLLYKVLIVVCTQGINQSMDDIISMGYRQSITIQEVTQQLKMESTEEKAHLALLKQQEEQAKQANQKKSQAMGAK